jgi:branched-subunit amino acid ABC-type transport system permease component
MNLLLDVLTTAAILYIVSAGLLLIFGVMKIINFAHGSFLTVGAYASLVSARLGLPPLAGLAAALLAGAVVGMAIEYFVVRRLYARPLDAILATWGLAIVLGQTITLAFGREVQFVASPVNGTFAFLGADYSAYRLLLVGAAALLGATLALLLTRTHIGLVTRAVIMNEQLARGLGIHAGLVRFFTFAAGAGIASLAGALITPLSSVDPNMGVPWLINAFMLVMVSGVSMLSLLVATLVFGAAQVLLSTYVSPILGGLAIAVLAAVTLRIRPKGFSRD